MAVQARTVDTAKESGLSRRDWLITALIGLVGVIMVLLAGYSVEAGEHAIFTDLKLGTLFSVPTQQALYTIGGLCFFAAGLRLYRGLGSLNTFLGWGVAFMVAFAFLIWMTSGTSLNLTGMIQSMLTAATPLTLGAMAGIFCERSGIINIAIEGMMLWGAFAAVAFASILGSLWLGLLAASITGGIMALLLAVLSIQYKVDQIIAGTVINILAAGGTRTLSSACG